MGVDDDGMQCTDHPYRSTSPGGGICAFCLQEKLGKLVSSSSSSFFIGSSSPSSFRSDIHPSTNTTSSSSLSLSLSTAAPASTSSNVGNQFQRGYHINNNHQGFGGAAAAAAAYHHRRARIPFLLTQKKKKKSPAAVSSSSPSSNNQTRSIFLKRSKSTATPRSAHYLSSDYTQDFSPRRRGFWSFLHLSNTPSSKKFDKPPTTAEVTVVETPASAVVVVDETDDSPNSSGSNAASFGRKVSRSRSVGCGSRSFSGDFFERISTGFGDCTLRRVESQREGTKHRHSTSRAAGDTIREKARCGGIFGGFIITSSSSSISSSSSYWTGDGRPNGPSATPGTGPLIHGRSRSWGWAFASPMRAFAKTTTTTIKDNGKRELGSGTDENSKNSNGTPNLAAIPSLLAVRG